MPLPKKLALPRDLDPRLVTKTSLSDPKRTIALLIIMWYAAGKPGSHAYGLEIGKSKYGFKATNCPLGRPVWGIFFGDFY